MHGCDLAILPLYLRFGTVTASVPLANGDARQAVEALTGN